MDANINGLTITGNTITSDGTTTKAKFGIKEVGYNSNCSNINIILSSSVIGCVVTNNTQCVTNSVSGNIITNNR